MEKSFINFTTKDGLPSNETYFSLVDDEGYLWVATDRGVAKFDGFDFTVFDEKDGLEDLVVFRIYKDESGRMWFATMSGKIYYHEAGLFKEFIYNDVLLEEISANAFSCFILDFEIIKNRQAIISTNRGLFNISYKGSIEKIAINPDGGYSIYSSPNSGKIYSCFDLNYNNYSSTRCYSIFDSNLQSKIALDNDWRNTTKLPRILNLSANLYFLSLGSRLLLLDQGVIVKDYSFEDVISGFYKENNNIHIFFSNKKSACYNLKDNTIQEGMGYLSSVSSGIKSGAQTILTTLKNGIYIGVDKENQVLFENENIHDLAVDGDEIYGLSSDENPKIYCFNSRLDLYRSYAIPSEYYPSWITVSQNVCYVSARHLYSLRDNVLQRESKTKIVDGDLLKENDSLFWCGNYVGILKFNLQEDLWFRPDTSQNEVFRARDIDFYNDSIIVSGGPKGLAFFNKFTYQTYLIDKGVDVSKLTVLNDSKLIVVSKNNDVLMYNNGVFTSFCKLDFENVRFNIAKSDEDYVYLGSESGLFVFDFDGNLIRKYNRENKGLSNDIVNCLKFDGDRIFVGTNGGINIFSKSNIGNSMDSSILKFKHSQASEINLTKYLQEPFESISLSCIAAFPQQSKSFFYCINSGSWLKMKGFDFSVDDLNQGENRIQLKYLDSRGIWSNSLEVNVSVVIPFYKKSWFYILVTGVSILIVILFARWRINKIQNISDEQKVTERRISDLKDQALRSKLNPHFMFNALNSIQRLYVDNNQELANDYLADFSILLRKILDLSEQKFITIEEETETLNLYLELESLRTNKSFNYSILIDDEVDVDQKNFPSLLLQPIVENAIWHGILPMTSEDFEGEINISFQQKDNLLCTISDNGVGYQKSLQNRKKLHEPKGVIMTRERLEGFGEIEIRELKPSGTVVELKININD